MFKLKLSVLLLLGVFFFTTNGVAQQLKLSTTNSSVTVSGTSSLHDWDVVSESFSGTIKINDFTQAEIESLFVNVPAESLKSGKGAMDNKIYDALKTKKNKSITFKMTEVVSSSKVSDSEIEVKVKGDLQIAGTTKNVPLTIKFTQSGSTVKAEGSYTMKMTGFNVEPPTAMFGTITTGDEITIKFNVSFI
ncbi:MAG: hypothetical protein BM564_05680 [Bacteroidetes bacterium MedPE-SWsnd-G2]|nr:MAG: hypothetical protein BM564_05680 [Bacteroidetes bacterium MedPE-SWsnd-G2]